MKINYIDNKLNNKQSFKGIGEKIVNGMVKTQDVIAGAGLAATFISQDFLGSEAPRVVTGLFRNKDKTGELNYKFAAMEACREFCTAPVMMALPIATFAAANKYIGGAVKSPVSVIENFTDKLESAYRVGSETIKDGKDLKKAFYSTAWDDALRHSCGDGYEPPKSVVEKLSSLMEELETARKSTFKEKFKKVKGIRTIETISDEISDIVSGELKANANVKNSFSRVIFKDGNGKTATSSISAFTDHMSRYAKDSVKNLGEKFKDLSLDDLFKQIKKYKNKRIGARVLMNFASVAAVVLYVTQVPKLYKSLNKTNPGLIGLEEKKAEDTAVAQKPVDYEAFEKYKKANNQVAFKGLLTESVAKIAKKEGFWRKLFNAFEFDGINMACAAFLTALGLGVFVPRVANSYDKHDRREIITRDGATIGALVVGAKAIQKTTTRLYEKKTGMALSEKAANYFEMSKPRRIFEHLRPFGGVQVYSNNDIVLKYSNIDKFKNGIAGFCEYVVKSGGNLVKLFANDKTTKENIENMLGKALNKSTNEEIMAAVSNKENAKFVEKIVNVFKDTNNPFIKKGKAVTGVFGFVSTFIAVPAFIIFLQKFNEKVTKNAIAKEQQQKKITDQKFTAVRLTTDLLEPESSKLNLK